MVRTLISDKPHHADASVSVQVRPSPPSSLPKQSPPSTLRETLADVVPGDLYTVPVDGTNPLAWRFEEGHRIGLILTSSNYSRFERASNTGTVIYEDAASPVVVTNTLVAGESVLRLTRAPR